MHFLILILLVIFCGFTICSLFITPKKSIISYVDALKDLLSGIFEKKGMLYTKDTYESRKNSDGRTGTSSIAQDPIVKLNGTIQSLLDEIETLKERYIVIEKAVRELDQRVQTQQSLIVELKKTTSVQQNQYQYRNEENDTTSYSQRKMYAYGTSCMSPFGFTEQDLSQDTNAPFCIIQKNLYEADVELVDNEFTRNTILSALTYYKQLIDYTDLTQGIMKGFSVVKDGKAVFDNGIWKIMTKIQLNIY